MNVVAIGYDIGNKFNPVHTVVPQSSISWLLVKEFPHQNSLCRLGLYLSTGCHGNIAWLTITPMKDVLITLNGCVICSNMILITAMLKDTSYCLSELSVKPVEIFQGNFQSYIVTMWLPHIMQISSFSILSINHTKYTHKLRFTH